MKRKEKLESKSKNVCKIMIYLIQNKRFLLMTADSKEGYYLLID